MQIHEERNLVGSAEIIFTCPNCDGVNQTDALRFETIDKYLGLVTIWKSLETAVKCPECEATCRTKTGLDRLSYMSTEELSGQFSVRIGFVEKFLVIAGTFLFVVPIVSLCLFVVAWFLVPKAAIGWRRLTKVGILVTGFLTLVIVAILIFDLIFG